jgi:membrane-associated phospholipid phosphatase
MTGTRLRRGTTTLALCAAILACGTTRLQALQIDPLRDGIAFGISAAFAGASELLIRFMPPLPQTPEVSYAGLSPMDMGAFYRYSEPVDLMSTILETAAMLTPLAMSLAANPADFFKDTLVYGESFGFAMGTKNVAKYLFPRYRPGVNASEDNEAFPSGHSTMVFTAAAFTTYMYVHGLPGSAPLLPFVFLNYALAGLTGSYRVLAGMHFPSDVAAGAAIGMVFGFALPMLLRQ